MNPIEAEYKKTKAEIYGTNDVSRYKEKFPNHFTYCRHRDNSYWYGDMQNIIPQKCQWYHNKICKCMNDNKPCDGVVYVPLTKKREINKLIEQDKPKFNGTKL